MHFDCAVASDSRHTASVTFAELPPQHENSLLPLHCGNRLLPLYCTIELLPLYYENGNGLLLYCENRNGLRHCVIEMRMGCCHPELLPLHCYMAFGVQACGMWWMAAGPSRRSYRREAAWPSTMCAGSARPRLSSGQAALAEPALATATGPSPSKALFDVAERLELCVSQAW